MSFWDALAHPEAGGRERTPKPPELRAGFGFVGLESFRSLRFGVRGLEFHWVEALMQGM